MVFQARTSDDETNESSGNKPQAGQKINQGYGMAEMGPNQTRLATYEKGSELAEVTIVLS